MLKLWMRSESFQNSKSSYISHLWGTRFISLGHRLSYDRHVGLFGKINKDVDEARELWANSPLFMKLALIVSLVLTTSSVASFVYGVFEWKGFDGALWTRK